MADDFDPQRNITTFWSARGPEYDAGAGHGLHSEEEHRLWLQALGDLLPPAPADVLDLGCGTGFLAFLMAELGHRVTGFDLADGMLAQAHAKAAGLTNPPRFEIGDATAPSVADASVDAIASRHVLWTLVDPPRAFANWRRALRPGGRVVAINGLWKDTNIARARREGAMACPFGAEALERHQRYYTPEVEARLPLMRAESESDFVIAFQEAGFVDVGVRRMLEIEAVEPVPDGGAPRASYVVVATRPA
jgi:ubiquinone/menaquinone biosynthesis C-methylase UbiE